MTDIDQTSIIEQLVAENAALREVLRHSPDREIQVASALAMVIDELTRLGPNTAARVLNWAFARYGIDREIPASYIRNRRPKEFVAAPAEPATPPAPHSPHTQRQLRGKQLRARRFALGMTQWTFAQHVGMKQTDISEIERGKRHVSEERWALLWEAAETTP